MVVGISYQPSPAGGLTERKKCGRAWKIRPPGARSCRWNRRMHMIEASDMVLGPDTSSVIPGEPLCALRRVRWLAERCGVPPADVFPQLAGALLDERAPAAVAHCCWW